MDDKHVKILRWFQKELLLSLNMQTLFKPLRTSKLITPLEEKRLEKLEEADWNSEADTCTAKKTFLRLLESKGPDAFMRFLNVLRDEKEHLGHKSLYNKLVEHKDGKLPRCESEPAELEKLILTTPKIRHGSISTKPNFKSVPEEGSEVRLLEPGLDQIWEKLQLLERKIDSFFLQFSEQNNVASPYTAIKDYENKEDIRSTTELAGLPRLLDIKASCMFLFIPCIKY